MQRVNVPAEAALSKVGGDERERSPFGTKCRASAATQPIMIGWARRIMIRLEGPAHARVPTFSARLSFG
jgi:hypothetical protein